MAEARMKQQAYEIAKAVWGDKSEPQEEEDSILDANELIRQDPYADKNTKIL